MNDIDKVWVDRILDLRNRIADIQHNYDVFSLHTKVLEEIDGTLKEVSN